MTRSTPDTRGLFRAGLFLGLGLGGFFDGIVLHQILQWHHLASSAGYPPTSIGNIRVNVLLDGLFHAVTYVFVAIGITLLWRAGVRAEIAGRGTALLAAILMGFGLFNLVEGSINHQLLGLHHVNEIAPREHWIWWDLGFLAWGAAMLVGGWIIWRKAVRG